MPHRNYSGDADYDTQGFEEDGVVSIWIGMDGPEENDDTDVLQDLCGVGYYRLDDLESNARDGELAGIDELLGELSYSKSFIGSALEAVRRKGLSQARWVTVQFDFKYDPAKVKRPIAPDPVFLGSFRYSTT